MPTNSTCGYNEMMSDYPFPVVGDEFAGKRTQSEGIGEEAARRQIIARSGGIPLGRTGRPAEIAELVAFLASDRAAFASGVDYFLDGGAFPAR